MLQIDVSRVVPNPSQPRESFDAGDLESLAASIRAAGVLQPILVRDTGSGYELIAGERRLRAARLAGLQTVPAILQSAGKGQSLELALIENIQREQLNPIEEARAFASLMADYGLTQEAVADKVGRKRPSIANTLRLLKLPEPVQEMIRDGRLTAGHAKALLTLAGEEEILRTADAMLQGFVTVRGAEEMARQKRPADQSSRARQPGPSDPNVRDAELRLQRALGTKVRIHLQRAGKGRIEIEFYSEEELDRLFERLECDQATP